MNKNSQTAEAIITLVFIGAAFFAVKSWVDDNSARAEQARIEQAKADDMAAHINQGPPAHSPKWISPLGHIWSGVKLYYGPKHRYVGEILGANDKYIDPITGERFKALKIRYPGGQTGWKRRDSITGLDGDDRWQIQSADPAIDAMHYDEYEN